MEVVVNSAPSLYNCGRTLVPTELEAASAQQLVWAFSIRKYLLSPPRFEPRTVHSKNLGTTFKFLMPERWHEASSTVISYKPVSGARELINMFYLREKNNSNYAVNIRCQCTQFSCTGNQGLMICAPLFYMFIFCRTACKVGNAGENSELPGSLTTAKRLVQNVMALQSDPTANNFFINCIFFHSYNLLNVFWKSACTTKDTHNCQVKK
jgi:hypothetical protein